MKDKAEDMVFLHSILPSRRDTDPRLLELPTVNAYQGQGLGKKLYTALFDSIRKLGFHYAYGGIALPNDSSIALHKACGFSEIGTFREVGFKNDVWHDVSWWQRKI